MELHDVLSTDVGITSPHTRQIISYSGNFYGNIIPYQQAPFSTQEPPTQNIQNFQEIK